METSSKWGKLNKVRINQHLMTIQNKFKKENGFGLFPKLKEFLPVLEVGIQRP